MHNAFPIPSRYLEEIPKEKLAKIHPNALAFRTSWSGDCGALLIGPTGCGKSLCVARAARHIIQQESETWVKWIRADELSRLLSVRGGVDEVAELKLARILVIDELGYERFPELVLEVLGARHDANRPTVVTSGLKLDAFEIRYGDSTVRRIIEIGDGMLWPCHYPFVAAVRSGLDSPIVVEDTLERERKRMVGKDRNDEPNSWGL